MYMHGTVAAKIYIAMDVQKDKSKVQINVCVCRQVGIYTDIYTY